MVDLLDPNSSVNINRIAIIDADCLAVGKVDSRFLLGKQSDAVAALDQLAIDEDGENMAMTLSPAAPLRLRMTKFELSVAYVIGINELGKLVFLSRSFWVCSVDLSVCGLEIAQCKDSPAIEVFEHFFVLSDWFAGKRDIVCALAERDIMMTRGGDLAVIRGGLDYAERVCIV